jgi:hypothetical protein
MARRCTTVPGLGVCCRAAQQGIANQVFKFTDRNGHVRCAECSIVQSTSRDPRKAGRQVFQFRFHKNQECGIGPGGCPALQGQGAAAGAGFPVLTIGQ